LLTHQSVDNRFVIGNGLIRKIEVLLGEVLRIDLDEHFRVYLPPGGLRLGEVDIPYPHKISQIGVLDEIGYIHCTKRTGDSPVQTIPGRALQSRKHFGDIYTGATESQPPARVELERTV
jgi:hypothetical protein